METLFFSIIGGGIISLLWYVYKAYAGYLQINLLVNKVENVYTARTHVENPNEVFDKYIEVAFLLITLEEADIIEAAKKIASNIEKNPDKIKYSDDFNMLKKEDSENDIPIYIENIGFIPLTFYYSENVAVGNEKLPYTCSIDKDQLKKGIYSVRFYVFPKKGSIIKRYHISCQDLMVIS